MAGLQSAAQQLQAYGRGPDTMLAHISPDEAEFIDAIQGGRRTNPQTGLPEYSLFGKILKAVVRVGASIGGFMVGGPLGAAAGSAAATKLTGGSWKQALKAGAMAGVGGEFGQGLSGAGWSVTGASAGGAGAAAGTGTLTGTQGLSASLANAGGSAAVGASPGFYSGLANAGSAAGGAGGASGLAALSSGAAAAAPTAASGLGAALVPIGGYGGAAAGLGGLATPLSSEDDSSPTALTGNNINLNVAPFNRQYRPYTGDPAKYGEQGGWQFFDDVNPKPQFLAMGGAAGPRDLGQGLGGLAGLRNPGIPSQIESPHLSMPGAAPEGIDPRNMTPAAQRQRLRQAAMIGYVNAKDGGAIYGPGTETSDDVPAMLSNNEHVIDAESVRLAGKGSYERGHKAIERFKQKARREGGMKNPKKPPAFGGA